jgi:predicted nucleotidyltransferase
MPERKTILEGVVGSQAYGLATESSDVDLRGVFVYPLKDILSIRNLEETIDSHEPDVTLHELVKFCRLAAQGNPNILELLWLNNYTTLTDEGMMLIGIRHAFFSQRVRERYIGYALSQARRLVSRGNFDSDLKKRRAKHARHCFRLMIQGKEILSTGTLTVDCSEYRDMLFSVGDLSDEEILDLFNRYHQELESLESFLPLEPDYQIINDALYSIRMMNK